MRAGPLVATHTHTHTHAHAHAHHRPSGKLHARAAFKRWPTPKRAQALRRKLGGTCSPYRRPSILRSRKTVKPSLSQKCSQVAFVTRLPAGALVRRRIAPLPSAGRGSAPEAAIHKVPHSSIAPPTDPHPHTHNPRPRGLTRLSSCVQSRGRPHWPVSGRPPAASAAQRTAHGEWSRHGWRRRSQETHTSDGSRVLPASFITKPAQGSSQPVAGCRGISPSQT